MGLRRHLQGIPGTVIRARAGGGFFLMRGGGGEERVQVEVRGFDLEQSDALGLQVKKVVEGVPGVSDVRLSRDLGKPEELLVIDRQKAADMKLSVSRIGGTSRRCSPAPRPALFARAARSTASWSRSRMPSK